jgi:hypothetical protein
VDQAMLMDALTRWCSPGFAASVRAGGIEHVERSLADVAAMKTVYLRRQRRAKDDPRLLAQIDGVLRVLNSVQDHEILMLHFKANAGDEGIVLADHSETPLFAFELPRSA